MGSTTEPLPALRTGPKIIFFTDFDGTITTQDSNDYMTDEHGYGKPKRVAANKEVLEKGRPFRDAFREMMDSVRPPFDECVRILLEKIKLDPYFKEFYDWCRANNVPVVVLSGGMRPIIEALLRKLLGEKAVRDIQIVSNSVGVAEGKSSINEEYGWAIVYHDESNFGHDKSIEIGKYKKAFGEPAEKPIMFYAGDGVSDLSAAKETDLLFAKEGRDLVTYCDMEKVPYTTFNDFKSILETVKAVSEGKLNVKDVAKKFT